MENIIIIFLLISYPIFFFFLFRELKKFLREVLLIIKSKDAYEAKSVLETKEEEEEEARIVEKDITELEGEKLLELLQKENK
jgi:hypothetical protein